MRAYKGFFRELAEKSVPVIDSHQIVLVSISQIHQSLRSNQSSIVVRGSIGNVSGMVNE